MQWNSISLLFVNGKERPGIALTKGKRLVRERHCLPA
jgi:hypothetical protein